MSEQADREEMIEVAESISSAAKSLIRELKSAARFFAMATKMPREKQKEGCRVMIDSLDNVGLTEDEKLGDVCLLSMVMTISTLSAFLIRNETLLALDKADFAASQKN